MSATNIFLGLLIVLFMTLVLQWMRKLKPQVAGWITKDVSELRIDYVSTESALLGVSGVFCFG